MYYVKMKKLDRTINRHPDQYGPRGEWRDCIEFYDLYDEARDYYDKMCQYRAHHHNLILFIEMGSCKIVGDTITLNEIMYIR